MHGFSFITFSLYIITILPLKVFSFRVGLSYAEFVKPHQSPPSWNFRNWLLGKKVQGLTKTRPWYTLHLSPFLITVYCIPKTLNGCYIMFKKVQNYRIIFWKRISFWGRLRPHNLYLSSTQTPSRIPKKSRIRHCPISPHSKTVPAPLTIAVANIANLY